METEETKNCLQMYLEGLESRAIGRLLEISYGTVYKWVRKSGQEQMLRQSKEAVEVVEMDELHTYVGSKKNDRCVWIAVDRCTKRLIAFVCGDRSTQNCEKSVYCKAGFLRGIQRYRCKSCGYHYTVQKRSNEKSEETKKRLYRCIWKD